MNILSSPARASSSSEVEFSMETKAQDQLKWIDSELEKSSGSERHSLEKAREELLWLMHILEDIEKTTLLTGTDRSVTNRER